MKFGKKIVPQSIYCNLSLKGYQNISVAVCLALIMGRILVSQLEKIVTV